MVETCGGPHAGPRPWPRNEATIRRWWKRVPDATDGRLRHTPAMKPPSEDGGNSADEGPVARPRVPAMKPPSEDGGNRSPTRRERACSAPAMKPPSEDGGNGPRRRPAPPGHRSRNEATIRRWWKPGQGSKGWNWVWSRNEATIRRWWKQLGDGHTAEQPGARNEATIRRWWKHGTQREPLQATAPAMKPPSEDGGNVREPYRRRGTWLPAMKPPSEDGGNTSPARPWASGNAPQ